MSTSKFATKFLHPGYSQLSRSRTEFITCIVLCNVHIESLCVGSRVELVGRKSGLRGGPLENKSDDSPKIV